MPAVPANRLFFALLPDAQTRSHIATTTESACLRHPLGGRRIKPARYHLTLKFLGDTVSPAAEAAAIKVAAALAAPPFTLQLDRLGSFRSADTPAWLGLSEPPPELIYLDELLRRGLGERPRQRKLSFVPHVTILRQAKMLPSVESVAAIAWHVDVFHLVRSQRQPASYETVHSFPLRGGPVPDEPRQYSLLAE